MRIQFIGVLSGCIFFANGLLAQDRVPNAPDYEETVPGERLGEEILEEAEALPDRAAGWVLTLPARLHNASIGLHERSDDYSIELSADIDSSLEKLRRVLEVEASKIDPNFDAIRAALSDAAATMNKLDQLYKDINYYDNWDDAALVVEWVGFLGASRGALAGLKSKLTRNKVAAEDIRKRGKRGFWAWIVVWLGALAVDKLYLEPKLEHLKAIYTRQLLNTARLVHNLIAVDRLLVERGQPSVLATYPDLNLTALEEQLQSDFSFLKDLDEDTEVQEVVEEKEDEVLDVVPPPQP